VWKLDWKKASEEVCTCIFNLSAAHFFTQNMPLTTVSIQALVRAGVQTKEDKEMVRMEDKGELEHSFFYQAVMKKKSGPYQTRTCSTLLLLLELEG